MEKIVLFTSLKGGVGKTAVCASLAFCSAFSGKKTLAIDFDCGIRGLDIALGAENSAAADVSEVLSGAASLSDAIVPLKKNLFFLGAPALFNDSDARRIGKTALHTLMEQAAQDFDLVLFDLPAGGGPFLPALCESPYLSLALVVSTDAPTALRAAEQTGLLVRSYGAPDCRLILNRASLSPKDRSRRGLYDVIYDTAIEIFGVVPEEHCASRALQCGTALSALPQTGSSRALWNISERLWGKQVPLLQGVLPRRTRKKLYVSPEEPKGN